MGREEQGVDRSNKNKRGKKKRGIETGSTYCKSLNSREIGGLVAWVFFLGFCFVRFCLLVGGV